LRSDGIYVIEDTQTAYWTICGGGMNHPQNSVAYFKGLVDGLNHAEFPIVDYSPNYFEENIVEITFLHNMIFIRKGNNKEKSINKRELDMELAELAK
jgi:hypothetical protein